MGRVAVTWCAAAAVAGSAAGLSAEHAAPPVFLTVTVHVANYAPHSSSHLRIAQDHVVAVLRDAGVHVVWSPSAWAPVGRELDGTPHVDVRLVILSEEMTRRKCHAEKLTGGVMGTAISGATAGPDRIAWVFYDRIHRLARSSQQPTGRGLAHVIAHEIGHLLIGSGGHSDIGLMRGTWDPGTEMSQGLTGEQVRLIRRRFDVN